MSDPFIGEIKLISFNFAPNGWAFCNGQLLPINQNAALFSILGVAYGGNGQTNFALPNLQGRIPVHQGSSYTVGQAGGEASHVLTVNEMPAHNHAVSGQSATATTGTNPTGAVWAASNLAPFAASPDVTMAGAALGSAGNDQPHENQPPYLVLNFVIALVGLFPSRN